MYPEHAEAAWPRAFSPEVVRNAFGGGRLSSFCLALEAWRRGLAVTFTRADLHLYTVSDGERSVGFDCSRPDSLTPAEDHGRLDSKWESKRILGDRGIPVPTAVLLTDTDVTDEQLDEHIDALGLPLVIKPASGSMGYGVFAGIRTREDLLRHFRQLVATYPDRSVIIEQHIEGDDYRVLVVGDRVVAATHRVTAHIVGDGSRTIDELVRDKTAGAEEEPVPVIRADSHGARDGIDPRQPEPRMDLGAGEPAARCRWRTMRAHRWAVTPSTSQDTSPTRWSARRSMPSRPCPTSTSPASISSMIRPVPGSSSSSR